MQITIQLFGAFRPYGEQLELTLPDGATVADIRSAILAKIDTPQALLDSSRFATETEVLADNSPLKDGETYAIIPPVAGG